MMSPTHAHQLFSITLSLSVDALSPVLSTVASPVSFKAKVRDKYEHAVKSANVTFYSDSKNVGYSLADKAGIAKPSSAVAD